MNSAFAAILVKDVPLVFWKLGENSHDGIIKELGLKDIVDMSKSIHVRMIPANTNKYPYLYPELLWKIDKVSTPDWWSQAQDELIKQAFEKWKTKTYQFNYEEAREPINPFLIERNEEDPSGKEMKLLMNWLDIWHCIRDSEFSPNTVLVRLRNTVKFTLGDDIWNDVYSSVWNNVKDTMSAILSSREGSGNRDSMLDSMCDYIASFFQNVNWSYDTLNENRESNKCNNFASGLWREGLIPCYDSEGNRWQLYAGKQPRLVWEGRLPR